MQYTHANKIPNGQRNKEKEKMHQLIGSLKRSSLTALLQLNSGFPFFSPTFFSLFSAGEVASTLTN